MGASAGGLEAFSIVLRNLPAETGMAFVLIQHLDPKHESLLPDLLSKATRMPVEEVKDGKRVWPNRVYVIPPNTEVGIEGGVLRLLSRPAVRGQHMPVDHFLRSLAEDLKSRAIGVILSGTGSDGALGIEAVKGEGGITFAQNEESAKYDGMPRAAAATRCVDFILAPEEIARELTRIAAHPYVRTPDDVRVPDEASEAGAVSGPPEALAPPLTRIFSLLRDATSVDFSLYKHTTVRRRIGRRMALHRIDKLENYVQMLEQDPAEVEALYREILIKVTAFFRDPEMFQTLKAKVLPEIVGRLAPDTPIRVWVPGCASGEEAYSLAILLLEFLSERDLNLPIQVFATDISDEAIEKARAGIYVENIALDVSPERLRRFFVKHNGGYQVNKIVRDLCVFARQNVGKDPPFSKLDLISCRNVLIYLEPALQKRIIPMFHYALKPNGFLVLGESETVGAFSDLFDSTDKRHKIYVKRQILSPHRIEFERGAFTAGKPDGSGRGARPVDEAAGPDLQKEADRLVLANYGPSGVIINDDCEVLQFRGKTSPYLEPAPGRASLNLLKMLREGLLLEVRNAIQKAKRTGEAIRKKNIATRRGHGFHKVDFEVVPMQATHQGRHFLVLFQDSALPPASPKEKRAKATEDRMVDQLKQELVATRQYLQSIIEEQEATNEELQSANEEILSSNEELQSINEELETAKEELQSTNEELTTVNEELQNRNTELSQTNDDLNNLLSSVNIAIVMLGSDLRIRRFTPMAGRILNLIPTDVGRPITDLRPRIQAPDLGKVIGDVLETMTTRESEVADSNGHWYSMSVRPYRTSDSRVDGALLILVDIDAIKRGIDPGRVSRDFLKAVVNLAADPIMAVDREFRIHIWNPAFADLLGKRDDAIEGRSIEEVLPGAGGLRELLEKTPLADGTLREMETPLELTADGARLKAAIAALPLSGPDMRLVWLRKQG